MPLSTDDCRQDRVTYAAPPLPPPMTAYGEPSPRRSNSRWASPAGGCIVLTFAAVALYLTAMLCVLGTAGTIAVVYRLIGWIAGLP